MTGPFETPEQAWQAGSAVVGGAGTETRTRFITASLTTDGVALGAFEVQIARWLARFDEETIAVVLSWPERAYVAGKQAAGRARQRDALTRILELATKTLDDESADRQYMLEDIQRHANEALS